MSIPVQHDSRTFEERRRALLDRLEGKLQQRGESTEDNWDREVKQWIQESRSKWDEDMKRMRKEFFNLESHSGLSSSLWPGSLGFEESDMRQLEGSRSLLQQMSSCSVSSVSNNSISTSSSVIKSDSTKSSSSTSTTMNSSAQQKSTSTSSTNFSTNNVVGQPTLEMPTMPTGVESLLASSSLLSKTTRRSAFEEAKNLYEVGEDGQMHYKVRFDAQDFSPEDIQVTTTENRLMVKAKTTKQVGNSTSVKEFSRTIDLPDCIEHAKFQCHLTKDGVLVIDAPVIAPDYAAISLSHHGELGIKPRGADNASSFMQIAITGESGPVVLTDTAGHKRIHLELAIQPGFESQDIHVRAEGHKIYIHGHREDKAGGRSCVKEFSKYYEVPEALDPLSVKALLNNGVLVVEAPLHRAT